VKRDFGVSYLAIKMIMAMMMMIIIIEESL